MLLPTNRLNAEQEELFQLAPEWQEKMRREDWDNGWTLLELGSCHSPALDYRRIAAVEKPFEIDPYGGRASNGMAEWNLVEPIKWETDDQFRSLLSSVWEELLPVPYIPYDMATRREVCHKAYAELAEQISLWEATSPDQA